MSERIQEKFERERFLLRYTDALIKGDFDTQDELSLLAEGDASLEEAIWEIHLAVGEEMQAEAAEAARIETQRDATTVTALAASNFPGRQIARPEDARAIQAALSAEEETVPPVTVGDVAANLQSKIATGSIAPENPDAAKAAVTKLVRSTEPLPERVTAKTIRTLLMQMGTDVGNWFEKLFHESAHHLTMGRQQNIRLAAARRVRESKSTYRIIKNTDFAPEEKETKSETDETPDSQEENTRETGETGDHTE